MLNILNSFDLSGKTAVITGGAGLYGKQIVTALAQANAVVYLASRGLEQNLEIAAELTAQGWRVYAEKLDLSDEKSIKELCDTIYKKAGRVDVLINNAVWRSGDGYSKISSDTFDKSMHINATGLFLISRAFGDKMMENGGGSIINIGSYMGILGPDYSLYEGTNMCPDGSSPDYFFHKGGMTNYTRFLASHYGRYNIRCNCLELGGLFNNQNEFFVERYCRNTCLGRMANATDLMGIIVFLASDASAYITGTTIPVDGGYSAK